MVYMLHPCFQGIGYGRGCVFFAFCISQGRQRQLKYVVGYIEANSGGFDFKLYFQQLRRAGLGLARAQGKDRLGGEGGGLGRTLSKSGVGQDSVTQTPPTLLTAPQLSSVRHSRQLLRPGSRQFHHY